VCFFLFVDTLIILCAYPLRNGENWVGIVSVLWALLVTAWAVNPPPLPLPPHYAEKRVDYL
jgi:hypothetical protein